MSARAGDAHYQVSADRCSASRRVRYVETNRSDANACTLCQLEDGRISMETGMYTAMQNIELHEEDFLVQQHLTDTIERQLLANTSPTAGIVLNRLLLAGTPREEAIDMMAYVLAVEVQHALLQARSFDVQAYEILLRALPELPELPEYRSPPCCGPQN